MTDPQLAARPPRIDALDGLRFLAVAHVVVRHLGEPTFAGAPFVLEKIRRHAYHMMPLFFVMSGFVLTYVYGEKIRSGTISRRAFWLSRAFRIWPVYLVALAIRFADDARMNHGVTPEYLAGTLAQAVCLQNWIPPLVWYGNAPGWTVSVEVFLYLLFPWLVVRFLAMSPARAVSISGAAWVAGMVPGLVYSWVLPDGESLQQPGSPYLDALRFLPPLHLPSFLVGIATARVLLDDRDQDRSRRGTWLVLCGLIPILSALVGVFELVGHPLVWPFALGHNGLLSPAWALVILGLSHGGLPSRPLSSRLLVRLGGASYGLYILHLPIYDVVVRFVPGGDTWNRTPFFLVQLFAILLPLVVLSFERFEEPLRASLLARFVGKPLARAGS